MASISVVSLMSVIMSVFAILLSIFIFNKVYQENYKKPWLFIGISAIIIGISQLMRFFSGFFGLYFINPSINEITIYFLDFMSISILAYGLLLEYFILKFYKGKFVKMKLLPVQEGTLGGELDINVSNANSYLALKKDRAFLFEQFSSATRKGFEGFLITELNPRDTRLKYGIPKTPICWINQNETANLNKNSLSEFMDENSENIDPVQLNNLISFIDNFLEQSQNPFIVIELNQLFKINNSNVVIEFLKYVSAKSQKYNGILICMINSDVIDKSQKIELQSFLKELE